MSAEFQSFQAFYNGFIQHPLLLWLAAGVGVGVALTRRGLDRRLTGYCMLLGSLCLVDAWLTANHVVGIGRLPSWAASAVPLFFVLAGDFRFLLVAVAGTSLGGLEFDGRRLLLAAGLTLIVPVASQLIMLWVPASLDTSRFLFLVYESFFVALTLALMRFHGNVRSNPWLRSVARFVVLYYALWATSDAILLVFEADLAYGLRVVPNLLYYGGLIAAIARFAPVRSGPAADA